MEISMNKEQHEFVLKYQKIYDRLAQLEGRMQELQAESQALIEELETLREEERTKFKTEE
jgi:cell division protein FtsB